MLNEWKVLDKPFEKYSVNALGEVKNDKTGKILTQPLNNVGYKQVFLYSNTKPVVRKCFLTHRLVALHFVPNYFNKPEVNHIDEDKTNNKANNLEWATHQENVNFGTRNKKISLANQKPIKCLTTGQIFTSIEQASLVLGISRTQISRNVNGKIKTAKGLVFEPFKK